MNNELQQKLFDKYPRLFKQRKLSMSETAMCWGIDCGPGWYDLLDQLCGWINWHMEKNAHTFPQVEFTQVKEKFGQLRVYYETRPIPKKVYDKFKKKYCTYLPDTYDEYMKDLSDGCGHHELEGAISFAETLSGTICEDCGKPGTLDSRYNWYSTLCPKCDKKLKFKHSWIYNIWYGSISRIKNFTYRRFKWLKKNSI